MLIINIIIPILVLIFVSAGMYLVSKDKEKSKPQTILTRNVLPGIVMALLVYAIIKFKDSDMFNPEPLMSGNYFE